MSLTDTDSPAVLLKSGDLDSRSPAGCSGAVAGLNEKGLSSVFTPASRLPKMDPPSELMKGLVAAGTFGV